MSPLRPILGLAFLGLIFVTVRATGRGGSVAPSAFLDQVDPVHGAQPGSDTAQVRAFLGALRGANAVQCELALHALHHSYTTRIENPVPDRQPEAWALVSWASRRVRDPLAIPALAAAFHDGDPCVRRAAARLLGGSKLPAARTRLLEALRDAEPLVRQLAALGLGFASDPAAVTPLVRALGDRDPGVRSAAAWALGALH
jgi:HEAT repeat protein